MNISTRSIAAVTAAIAGFLYFAGSTQAQHVSKSSIDTSRVYPLDEVIISASRFEEPSSTVGRNVTVITEREIDHSVYTDVAGILAEQQSLHVVGDRQTLGSVQSAFLRNTNGNHFAVMIDGVKISDPSSNNNGIDLSELSLAGVKRIEIVRGSHSTLYGSSAIGGVINIVTQKQDTSGVNLDLNTQRSMMGLDAYSTSNSAAANITSEGGLYAHLSVFEQYSEGLDATIDTVSGPGRSGTQDRDSFKKLDLAGKLGYHTSAVDVYGSFRRADQSSEVDQGAFADDDNARTDFTRNLFGYGGSYIPSDWLSLNFNGAYSNLTRDFVNDSSVVGGQGSYDGIYTETNGEGALWKNEVTATLTGDHIRLLVGAGSNRQEMTSRTYTYASASDYELTTDLDSLDLEETINSVFVHASLNGSLLSNNLEAFSLVLGSRLVDHNQFGTHQTYEINPQVQITPTALVYGAVTTGFNAPSLYQLYSPEQGFGAYTSRGNETLDPETSVSYELGWKQSFRDLVQFELSLFRTNVRNVIEYIYLWNGATGINDLGAGDYLGDTYINIARQDIDGVELGLNVYAIPSVTIGGNVTYTHSTLTFSPNDIDETYTGGNHVQVYESGVFVSEETDIDGLSRRPSVSANIRLDYRPDDQWAFNITSRFVGDRDDVFYSAGLGPYGAQDRSEVSGYNLTDVGVRYRFTSQIAAGVQVENIFDTSYTEINGYRTKGRGVLAKASFSL